MRRLTEYHSGVAVIRDKSKLSEAMAKLARYEDLEKNGGWIPVSERLPEGCRDAEIELLVTINEEYIEASFDETVPALYYPETKTFHSVYRHRVDITNIVTAWRPLPEPYRKDV